MTVHVAFIRATMIGREGLHREVVLDLFRDAGARNPVSYIATGNVSFDARPSELATIVARVEAGIEAIVGRPKPLFTRTLVELVDLVDAEPFAAAPFPDPDARSVLFFRESLRDVALPIRSPLGDVEIFARSERELFSVSRRTGGQVRSPGGTAERVTDQLMTARAWSTVTTIVTKLNS